jgi:hypothetical protein
MNLPFTDAAISKCFQGEATFVSNFVKLEIVVLEPLMRFTEKISKISQ